MQAAQSFTFMTNSSTVFSGTSMSGMAGGMLLMVDATLQADGSLMATRVQSMMNSGGVMGGGIVTAVTGQPPTSLTMVMQNGAGNGYDVFYVCRRSDSEFERGTTYEIDDDNMDMSGLSFTPVFDASHIYAGQSVMPISSGGMMSGGGGHDGRRFDGGYHDGLEVVVEAARIERDGCSFSHERSNDQLHADVSLRFSILYSHRRNEGDGFPTTSNNSRRHIADCRRSFRPRLWPLVFRRGAMEDGGLQDRRELILMLNDLRICSTCMQFIVGPSFRLVQ